MKHSLLVVIISVFCLVFSPSTNAYADLPENFDAPGSPVTAMAASDDGRWLSIAINGVISVFDTSEERVVRSWIGHDGDVHALDFNANGSLLLSGSEDGFAKIWNWRSDSASLQTMAHDEHVVSVAFLSDVVVTGLRDGQVFVWRDGLKDIPGNRRHRYGEVAIAAKRTGNAFLSGAFDQALILFENDNNAWAAKDLVSGKRGYKAHLSMIYGIALLPPEEKYAISVGWIEQSDLGEHHAKLWDTHTGALVKEFGLSVPARGYVGIAVSRSGDEVAFLRPYTGIEVYETTGFSKQRSIQSSKYGHAVNMVFSGEESMLAVGKSNGIVEFWPSGADAPHAVLSVLGPNWTHINLLASSVNSGSEALDILP